MCGIAGRVHFDRQPINRALLRRMTDIQAHRGPDGEGYYFDDTAGLGLGHRRLSIIDLSEAGHQPMGNEDGTIWITYNGEVYNYLELRRELKAKGHVFKSQTDTEVVIHAYEEWGEECLQYFNGMWSFAIWDSTKQHLFCARDRFGIKPFYYFYGGRRFLFASEIKALLEDRTIDRKLNERLVYGYLAFGICEHLSETFFSGIQQLPPAHYLVLNHAGIHVNRYWDLEPACRDQDRPSKANGHDAEEYARQFYHLLRDSVRLRLRSDVPVGTCLSGGLDSSSIVCLMRDLLSEGGEKSFRITERLKTFSSCFDEQKYDERDFIQAVLQKTRAEENLVFPSPHELFDVIPKMIWHQDEPFESTSIYAQWNVMKLAREKGMKVLLDGQGGDELLAGYSDYYFSLFADLFATISWRSLVEEMTDYFRSYPHRLPMWMVVLRTVFLLVPQSLQPSSRRLLGLDKPNWLAADFVAAHGFDRGASINGAASSRGGYFDRHLYRRLAVFGLPSLLRYEDRDSMAFSIEARVPFLDHRLVEFVFSLPYRQKIHRGVTKVILRNAMKGTLPEKVRTRADKMGFATPEDIWFRTTLKEEVKALISDGSFRRRRYFDIERVEKEFELHCSGRKNSSGDIWRWINLELWLQTFFET